MTVDEINSALCTVRCLPRGLLPSLQTSLITTWGNNLNPTPPTIPCTLFETAQIAAGDGVVQVPHGLGGIPPIVVPVMQCVADDAALGYSAGDEVPLYMWTTNEELAATFMPCISAVWVDSVNVRIQTCSFAVGNEGSVFCWKKTVDKQMGNPSSFDNWRLIVRCANCSGGFSAAITLWGPINTFAHGLGGTPSIDMMVLQFVNPDAGAGTVADDEMPAWLMHTEQDAGFGCVNPTSLLLTSGTDTFGQEGNMTLWQKGPDYTASHLTFATNVRPKAYNFRINSYTTPQITQNTGYSTYAHGLGHTPKLIFGVIECIANDAASGRVIGDEIPCSAFTQDASSTPGGKCSAALFGANATEIFVCTQWFSTLTKADLNTFQGPVPDPLNFKLKIYAVDI